MELAVSLNLNFVAPILESKVSAVLLKPIMGLIHVGTLVRLSLEAA